MEKHISIYGLVWLWLISMSCHGQSNYKDLFDLSLQELAGLKVKDVITQAAKWDAPALDLPFSVSFITPHNYYTPLLNSLHAVDQQTSSLVVSEYNDVTPQLYIRGIGSNSSGAGDDPSVAYMVNGINIARPGFHNQMLFDVERIEVIKGPQGTLYGKGVIGGAVNTVVNAPDNEMTFTHGAATVTDHGWALQAINNSVLTPQLTNRVSVMANDSAGYVQNHETGSDLGGEEQLALREQLAWRQGKGEGLLLFEFNHAEKQAPGYSYQGALPLPGFPSDLLPYRNKPYDVAMPEDAYSDKDFYFASFKYKYRFHYGDLISTTVFNKGDYEFEQLILPIDFLGTSNAADEKAWQASQEIRFEKNTDDYRWSAGLYLSKERIERDESYDFTGLVYLVGAQAALTDESPGITASDAEQDVLNSALFVNGHWDFVEHWRLSLGLREDRVKKTFDLSLSGGDPLNIALENSEDFTVDEAHRWQQTSYSIAISHFFSDTMVAYGRIASGFKAGNFNSLARSEASAFAASKPEKALNKELGVKGYYFDQMLGLNVAVFDIDYEDLQVFAGLESESNAPEAAIQGVEVNLKSKLRKNLALTLDYTYLKTAFERYMTPSGEDLMDKKLTRAPRHSFAVNIDYSWQDTQANHYWLQWQTAYTDEWFINPANTQGSRVPGYAVSNAEIFWQPGGSEVQASLWARNLFDKAYPLHAISQTSFIYTAEGSAWYMAAPPNAGSDVTLVAAVIFNTVLFADLPVLLKRAVAVCIGKCGQMACALLCMISVDAQAGDYEEYAIKMAYLYNFTKFVTWPTSAFEHSDNRLNICIKGELPAQAVVDQLQSKSTQGRKLSVTALQSREAIDDCHILYLRDVDNKELERMAELLQKRPILSVSDKKGFAMAQGVIQFSLKQGQVQLTINQQRARDCGIRISAQLLEMASVVSHVERI